MDIVWPLIGVAAMSAVNAAEVQGKLISLGMHRQHAWNSIVESVHEILPFTHEQAERAGSIINVTRPFGLSLGDRACLALAQMLSCPVFTADWAWSSLDLGIEIRVIR